LRREKAKAYAIAIKALRKNMLLAGIPDITGLTGAETENSVDAGLYSYGNVSKPG